MNTTPPAPLDEKRVARDPIAQFAQWFDDALAVETPHPHAMTLATASKSGSPSARMVLLKGFDARGFVFFSHYESRKGTELAQNPRASLVFYWPLSGRQVRVEGPVEKVSTRESDEYFRTRPRDSQLSAWASRQTEPLTDRKTLEDRVAETARRYGGDIPRPPFWGGYRVIPETVEFWQEGPHRLHDRIVYRRGADGRWRIERLAP